MLLSEMRVMKTWVESLCVNLLLLLHTVNSVRYEVIGPSDPITADAGDDIILPCYLKPNISAEDMKVQWFRVRHNILEPGTLVHLYEDGRDQNEDQILSYKGRTALFKEEMKKGNTSLKLRHVHGYDDGFYQCLVQSKSWYEEARIQLQVKAVGSQPVVSIEGHRDGGMGLLCESKGWSPEPELEWLDSKGVSLSSGSTETHRDPEGFYTVRLNVVVKETDSFICRLRQTHLRVLMDTEIHVPGELFDHTIPLTVSICVIVSVLATALLVIIWFIWKFKKKGQFINELRQHKVEVTLDPDTAHTALVLSDNKKEVRCDVMNQEEHPAGPKRFDEHECVLGVQGFKSQSFYYEVKVEGEEDDDWRVGVALESANRNGNLTMSPADGFWVLGKMWRSKNRYKAFTSPPVTITWTEKLRKVGVFVCNEERHVSFFDAETRSHIFTLTECNFTGKLFPLFYIYSFHTLSSSLSIL
ncbi:hypothetical protein UPYG_G00243800 [Umbra pygmaea]|uniref:Butyrophilin subfamily 1 member A1-like n=1 Tax=Umbra pygmaea TaxID=75934 RepID=A0ABD0WL80_UMBPY